jgi:hypothetical protein
MSIVYYHFVAKPVSKVSYRDGCALGTYCVMPIAKCHFVAKPVSKVS